MTEIRSMHTHTCNELRLEHIGQEVTLTGWVWRRRDHGGLIFVDLRDREGVTQISFDPEHSGGTAFHAAETIRSSGPSRSPAWCASAPRASPTPSSPPVRSRCSSPTSRLNTSKTPPFQIEDHIEAGEDIRLRYRYLDIRRPRMMSNLQMRSDFTFAIRQALHDRLFMEVETPALFKSTPEGARDFLVPSRIQPGHFYALPQSPQLLKQLLMVGGVERYYQVAKCFRDEDLRADRQPEFTQVDIEMSFVDQDDVMSTLEDVLSDAFAKMGVDMPTPLRRIDYWDAMDTYGSDKPDTRFGMELHDVTAIFAESKFKLFASAAAAEGQYVKAINARGAGTWPRAQIDKLAGVAADFGAKGLAWIAFREDGFVNSPIVKFFTDEEMAALRAEMDARPGDLVMFAVADRKGADEILGGMRNHMADALELPARATTSCGSSTSRCSTGTRSAAPTRPSTSPSPCPAPTISRPSRPIRWPRVPARMTSSWTATRQAAAACASTIPRCSSPCSRCSASPSRARASSSAFSWTPSSSALPPWAVSRLASTACACCWPAPIPSARSWRSPRPAPVPTSCPTRRAPSPRAS